MDTRSLPNEPLKKRTDLRNTRHPWEGDQRISKPEPLSRLREQISSTIEQIQQYLAKFVHKALEQASSPFEQKLCQQLTDATNLLTEKLNNAGLESDLAPIQDYLSALTACATEALKDAEPFVKESWNKVATSLSALTDQVANGKISPEQAAKTLLKAYTVFGPILSAEAYPVKRQYISNDVPTSGASHEGGSGSIWTGVLIIPIVIGGLITLSCLTACCMARERICSNIYRAYDHLRSQSSNRSNPHRTNDSNPRNNGDN